MRGFKTIVAIVATAIAVNIVPLSAQFSFSCVFQKQEIENRLVSSSSWEDLQEQQKQLQVQGFQIQHFELAGSGEQNLFWSIYSKDTTSQYLKKATDWKSVQELQTRALETGYHLSALEAYPTNSGVHFVGLWNFGKKDQQLWKLSSLEGTLKLVSELSTKQYYLQDIEIVGDDPQQLSIILLFEKGLSDQRTHLVVNGSSRAYLDDRLERIKSGYNTIDFESVWVRNNNLFVGIYQKGGHGEVFRNDLTFKDLQLEIDLLKKEGFQIKELNAVNGNLSKPKPVIQNAQNLLPAQK